MTPEQKLTSMLKLFRKFREQGAEVVYGVISPSGKIGLSLDPWQLVRSTGQKPVNAELRSEEDVRAWLTGKEASV